MKSGNYTYIIFLAATLFVCACSNISEEERLIYVKPAAVKRAVLIEDFTGQRCINCPKATDEIKNLQEQYGEDAVIAVGIHGGPLAFYTNGNFLGLRTETGDQYYNHWNLEYQPIGCIDRIGIYDFSLWNGIVRNELLKTAPVDIVVDADIADDQITMETIVTGIDGNTSGKLQLWLIEDEITAFQLMPDGTRNDGYVHHHVFRTTVNGLWGEDINVNEGETVVREHRLNLQDDWQTGHLSIVAFVYIETGIQQVTSVKLKQ